MHGTAHNPWGSDTVYAHTRLPFFQTLPAILATSSSFSAGTVPNVGSDGKDLIPRQAVAHRGCFFFTVYTKDQWSRLFVDPRLSALQSYLMIAMGNTVKYVKNTWLTDVLPMVGNDITIYCFFTVSSAVTITANDIIDLKLIFYGFNIYRIMLDLF